MVTHPKGQDFHWHTFKTKNFYKGPNTGAAVTSFEQLQEEHAAVTAEPSQGLFSEDF